MRNSSFLVRNLYTNEKQKARVTIKTCVSAQRSALFSMACLAVWRALAQGSEGREYLLQPTSSKNLLLTNSHLKIHIKYMWGIAFYYAHSVINIKFILFRKCYIFINGRYQKTNSVLRSAQNQQICVDKLSVSFYFENVTSLTLKLVPETENRYK